MLRALLDTPEEFMAHIRQYVSDPSFELTYDDQSCYFFFPFNHL
jgi:hypothetical protein